MTINEDDLEKLKINIDSDTLSQSDLNLILITTVNKLIECNLELFHRLNFLRKKYDDRTPYDI